MALWNKNKHDICPNPKDLKTLVTNYLGANSQIKINSKLTVPEGYYCVLGKRGKVADKFDTGEHFLNFASMPYMCRRFGIDKMQDGKQKEKFPCECYFVSKDLYAGQFRTYRKVEMGTRAYGIYKMHVYGMYSYKVSNPQELMQSLLNEYDYIKTGEAESIIEAWVNDLVVSTLEKKNFIINDVVKNDPKIAESIKISVGKLFATAGLELCELKIYKYKLPKQYQEQSDKFIALQNEQTTKTIENLQEDIKQDDTLINNTEQENFVDETQEQQTTQESTYQAKNQNIMSDSVENIKDTNISEQKNALDQQQAKEYNQIADNESEYVPFGNFKISNSKLEDMQVEHKEEKPKFVDLNLDNLYADKKPNTKRCLNCGAENENNADHCLLCGEKFIEGEY